MGKIKNWSKRVYSNSRMLWEHDNNSANVELSKSTKGVSGKWAVSIDTGSKIKTKTFDTKEEARRKAVKWMRKHPNP